MINSPNLLKLLATPFKVVVEAQLVEQLFLTSGNRIRIQESAFFKFTVDCCLYSCLQSKCMWPDCLLLISVFLNCVLS